MSRILWAAGMLLLSLAAGAARAERRLLIANTGDGSDGTLALVPTQEVMYGHDVFYQIPEEPIGTVVFFHGCVHGGGDFWPPSKQCSASICRGLPEEIAHTKQALARGYAVLAVSSADRTPGSMCFSWSADSADVAGVIRQFVLEQGLSSSPVYVVGVSSGGAFALKIPRLATVNGVVAEAIGVNSGDWGMEDARPQYPPTVFLDMLKDQKTAAKIAEDIQILDQAGIKYAHIKVYEKQLYPNYFSDRSPFLSPELSAKVVQGLKDTGMANEEGMLLKDPRYTKGWQAKLQQVVPELANTNDLVPDGGQVSESMNVAFAWHEINAEYLTAALVWLESKGKLYMNDVLSQYQIFGPQSELTADRLPPGSKPVQAGPQAPRRPPPPPPAPQAPPAPVAEPQPAVPAPAPAVPAPGPTLLEAPGAAPAVAEEQLPAQAPEVGVPAQPPEVDAPEVDELAQAPQIESVAKAPMDQVAAASEKPASAALPATSLLTAAAAVLVPVLLKRCYLQQHES